MKSKAFLIMLLSFLLLTSFAQQQKVAVYVTGQQTDVNKVLGDKLVEAFARSGKYMAIERTASFLAELSKEQNYQRTGAVDDNEVSRLGKQFGVQLVCVADVSEVFGQKYVSARLINVETAEVVNTTNTSSNLGTMEELLRVSNKIANELTLKTAQENTASEYNISYSEFCYRIKDYYAYPTTGYLLKKSDKIKETGHYLWFLPAFTALGVGMGVGLGLEGQPTLQWTIISSSLVASMLPSILCYSSAASYKKKAWKAYRKPYDDAMKELRRNEKRVSLQLSPSVGKDWAGVGMNITF